MHEDKEKLEAHEDARATHDALHNLAQRRGREQQSGLGLGFLTVADIMSVPG